MSESLNVSPGLSWPSAVAAAWREQAAKFAPPFLSRPSDPAAAPDTGGKITPGVVTEYCQDFAQRSILFLDILRRRGNQYVEGKLHDIKSVLIFDFEVVMRGDTLQRPVNYALVRVLPPPGVQIDQTKRPVVVIDPRAGQGPGIGGFKPVSEIGEAFKYGHPVYFIGFTANPLDGQSIEDIASAITVFIDSVGKLQPEASGKPFVIGNCQAGWHSMMAACMRPDLVGPILVAGAPLSYWAGVHGKNPMRYLGGLLGGSWIARLTSDLNNGIFDGAWCVSNFDSLNPANTYWTKQYNVWADPEGQEKRYLEFEKWWGDFVLMRGDEMQYIADNLFVGNKFSTAQIVTRDGIRLDLREVKSPIICFCSHGDNITPPQQALDWILDNYESVDEIRRSGQTILYCLHETAGHLAIFVGTKVAAKEHAGFVNYMELVDAMPPGLYEIVISDKPKTQSSGTVGVGDYDLRIEPRDTNDIRALGHNSIDDEREFETVARVSKLNNALYRMYLQPWVRAICSPQFSRATRGIHPLRLSYSSLSDKNPCARAISPLAERVRGKRKAPASTNPFLAMQSQWSEAITQALTLYGDTRDRIEEHMFHTIYGSPLVQACFGIFQSDGPPRQRPGQSYSDKAALDEKVRDFKGRLAQGDALDAAARAIVYVAQADRRVEARGFDALRRLLDAYPHVSLARFKEALREQWAILMIDERAAVQALPGLLPDESKRRDLLAMMKSILTESGKLNGDSQARLTEIERLFDADANRGLPH
jgi:pimeloyl-ACP methyl ester carboxylesterase